MLIPGEAETTTTQLRAGNPNTKDATTKMAEQATTTGASTTRRDAENLMAEARGITSPRMDLHHDHLLREEEATVTHHTDGA
jgi:hypothetical protein